MPDYADPVTLLEGKADVVDCANNNALRSISRQYAAGCSPDECILQGPALCPVYREFDDYVCGDNL